MLPIFKYCYIVWSWIRIRERGDLSKNFSVQVVYSRSVTIRNYVSAYERSISLRDSIALAVADCLGLQLSDTPYRDERL